MNGVEFIRFAGLLVSRFPSDEAALRTAVSRAITAPTIVQSIC